MKQTLFVLACFIIYPAYPQLQSRLVAVTDWANTSHPDSIRYFYSNGRGGGVYDYDFLPFFHPDKNDNFIREVSVTPTIRFDSCILYKKDIKYKVFEFTQQIFDLNNNCISDTFKRYDYDSLKLVIRNISEYHYDPKQRLTQVLIPDNVYSRHNLYEYFYNNQGDITTTLFSYYDLSNQTWQNYFQGVYQYNGANNLMSAYFNSPGHLGRYSAVYDATDRLIESITEYDFWARRTSYTYDIAGRSKSLLLEFGDGLGYFSTDSKFDIYYNQNTLLDSLITYTYDHTGNQKSKSTQRFSHNLFDQVTKVETEYLDLNTNDTSLGVTDYVYELYNPTNVIDVNITKEKLTIYPSPVSDEAIISIEWNSVCTFNISVMDVLGRRYKQWTNLRTNHYEQKLDVSNFPPGNYWIIAECKEGTLTQQLSVVRQ